MAVVSIYRNLLLLALQLQMSSVLTCYTSISHSVQTAFDALPLGHKQAYQLVERERERERERELLVRVVWCT